ncbi:hypothetical protein ACFFQF_13015 [Haladaptatus pallidirubidus]|uniref:Uncharacterized protein n=1 Tax=Haladaptatus pallidirubidus TaxID=1008152 RepID=A0AAV3UDF5_9EURY|nr:hypothetical protein [Haladaptatus pallidirubidus]
MSTITDSETRNTRTSDEEAEPSDYSLSAPIQFVGFWTAVALPFLYVPLLATGLDTPGQFQTFLILIAVNLAALLLGHRYRAKA